MSCQTVLMEPEGAFREPGQDSGKKYPRRRCKLPQFRHDLAAIGFEPVREGDPVRQAGRLGLGLGKLLRYPRLRLLVKLCPSIFA